VEVEGAAVRTYIYPSHLSATHGAGLQWVTLEDLLIYLDDVIIISPNFDTYISRLREVLDQLQAAGLKLKPSKCALLQEVKNLGHVVGRDGAATDYEKVQAMRDQAVPLDLPELRAFLGSVGYYRQYIPDFAGIAQLLNRLTAKGVRWQWTYAEPQAFKHLKDCLMEALILAYLDPAKEYILDTDASDHNVGAVLSQVQDGRKVVVDWWLTTVKLCWLLRKTTALPGRNADREFEVMVQRPEEAVNEPADWSPAATPLVELANTLADPNEMEAPQIHEDNRAGEEPPVPIETLVPESPPIVVDSPVSTAPPVQLEHSQCARAPLSYLKDFFCDLVDQHAILSITSHYN